MSGKWGIFEAQYVVDLVGSVACRSRIAGGIEANG
jgi:hypothetical protein